MSKDLRHLIVRQIEQEDDGTHRSRRRSFCRNIRNIDWKNYYSDDDFEYFEKAVFKRKCVKVWRRKPTLNGYVGKYLEKNVLRKSYTNDCVFDNLNSAFDPVIHSFSGRRRILVAAILNRYRRHWGAAIISRNKNKYGV